LQNNSPYRKITLDLVQNRSKSKIEKDKKLIIKRKVYLNRLISHKHNKRVKIITGVRRCGKSFLLFYLFKQYLIYQGIKSDHIIEIAFDNHRYKKYRNSDKCF